MPAPSVPLTVLSLYSCARHNPSEAPLVACYAKNQTACKWDWTTANPFRFGLKFDDGFHTGCRCVIAPSSSFQALWLSSFLRWERFEAVWADPQGRLWVWRAVLGRHIWLWWVLAVSLCVGGKYGNISISWILYFTYKFYVEEITRPWLAKSKNVNCVTK